MEPREYFLTVARELDGIRAPENLELTETGYPKKLFDFVWLCYDSNVTAKETAKMIIEKFGYSSVKNEVN